MKSVYDKHLRNHNFAVGDYVMLWFPSHQHGISQCFQPRWRGPWVMKKLLETLTVDYMTKTEISSVLI